MLTLDQSATSPKAIASLHQCKESVFNISNRSPVRPDGTAGDKSDEFGAALARVGCGQVLLARDRLIEASATARTILEREYRYCTGRETLYSALRQLINRAGAELPIGSMSWLATSTKDGLSRLVNQIINARSDGTSTVILLDLDAHPEPAPGTLRRLFGLTAAETQLAVELSRGRNLLDIARSRRLSRTTIRSHLAALFVKTQTRRQAELVALLGRIAILP
jgi:DNA-binding CsgD family transcriptional regulator